MDLHCRPRFDENGNKVTWSGDGIPNEQLYGPNGWCEADEPAFRCNCQYDGFAGPTCEIRTQQICVNQCNGHGECNAGFCKCHEGWYGHDCAFSRAGVKRTPGGVYLKPHMPLNVIGWPRRS